MLERPDALLAIDAAFPEQPLVLTLGGTIREMLSVVGRKPNHLYSLDAMGQPLAIGLGLALGVADDRRVVVVEGDGSLLMGFSALATIGHLRPANLVVVVLDNGVYLATGGQATAVDSVDLASAALAWAASTPGPILLRVAVGTAQPKTDFFLEDPVVLARQFMDWLQG